MAKGRDRNTYYKVSFELNGEMYQVCARTVKSSDLYGLIELGDFIFPESGILYNPGEERVRREFEGIRRTWIPYHAVMRVDEISDERESESKIVPLNPGQRPDKTPGKHEV